LPPPPGYGYHLPAFPPDYPPVTAVEYIAPATAPAIIYHLLAFLPYLVSPQASFTPNCECHQRRYQDNRPFTSLFSPGKLSPQHRVGPGRAVPPPPTLPGSSNLPSTNGLKPAAPFSQPATSLLQQHSKTIQRTQSTAESKICYSQSANNAVSRPPTRKNPDRGRKSTGTAGRLRERPAARQPAGSTAAPQLNRTAIN